MVKPRLKKKKIAGHGGMVLKSQLLGRLRQENCLNPGAGGCSEMRLRQLHSSLNKSETSFEKYIYPKEFAIILGFLSSENPVSHLKLSV